MTARGRVVVGKRAIIAPMTATPATGHSGWVRICHWIVTVSVVALAFSGVEILMVHPRLYWGEVGNDLTPPLIELPISRNHRHGGWAGQTPFFTATGSPISASRTYDIFNQNGWGRSLHFLAAWFLVITGAVYLLAGVVAGHFRRHLVPQASQLSFAHLGREVSDHLRGRIPAATGGPEYGLLQRGAYLGVVFLAVPLLVVTGLTMSPAIAAAFPFLLTMFGGHQSARTLHFLGFGGLMLFAAVHVVMVVKSGFRRQMRAMTVGHTGSGARGPGLGAKS
jgi:thiosulfate reductase cytochrome b subunit